MTNLEPVLKKWGRSKIVSSYVRNEARVSTLPTLIQYSTGIPMQSSKKRERKERDSNREGRIQIITSGH
jgi:predicted transcriptional regulator